MTTLHKPFEIDSSFSFRLDPEDRVYLDDPPEREDIEDGEIVESPKSPETRVDWDFCPKKRKFVTGDDRKVLLVASAIDADLAAMGRGERASLPQWERVALWNTYMQSMFPRPEPSMEEQLAKLARMRAYEVAQGEKRVREAGNVTYSDFGGAMDHWMARKD